MRIFFFLSYFDERIFYLNSLSHTPEEKAAIKAKVKEFIAQRKSKEQAGASGLATSSGTPVETPIPETTERENVNEETVEP